MCEWIYHLLKEGDVGQEENDHCYTKRNSRPAINLSPDISALFGAHSPSIRN